MHNCEFISRNSEKKKSEMWEKLKLLNIKLQLLEKYQNWEFIYYYSVAETGFHKKQLF